MTLISYAQNFEDVILWRALRNVERGFYIDIGANDPVIDSVSYAFYQRGWRGVNVEPMPYYAERLRAERPHDLNVERVISAAQGPITLAQFSGTGLTTASETFARQHERAGYSAELIQATPITLSALFDLAESSVIHWMKIDVEGMEEDVLSSWGAHPARPWIAVVEATLPNSTTQNYNKWEHELTARGYRFAYFDGLNRFYVHEAHSELSMHFGPGPNFFDNFRLSEFPTAAQYLNEKLAYSAAREAALKAEITEFGRRVDHAIEAAVAAVRAEAADNRIRLDAALAAAVAERDAALEAVSSANALLGAARAEGAEARARAASLGARLDEAAAKLGAAQRELQSANAQIRDLDWEARRAALHAQHVEARLAATLDSGSWKITAPLRAIGMAARNISKGSRAAARQAARATLGAGLSALRAAPPLKRALHAVAIRTPLGEPFLRFARHRPMSAAMPGGVANIDDNVETLPAPFDPSFAASVRERLSLRAQALFDQILQERSRLNGKG